MAHLVNKDRLPCFLWQGSHSGRGDHCALPINVCESKSGKTETQHPGSGVAATLRCSEACTYIKASSQHRWVFFFVNVENKCELCAITNQTGSMGDATHGLYLE